MGKCAHIYCVPLITISVNTGDKQGANWYQRHQIIISKAKVPVLEHGTESLLLYFVTTHVKSGFGQKKLAAERCTENHIPIPVT